MRQVFGKFFFPTFLFFFIILEPPLHAQSPSLESDSVSKNETEKFSDPDPESSDPIPSLLERRMAFEKMSDYNPFVVLPHKPTYLLPITYNASPNNNPSRTLTGEDMQYAEIKFQLSLKVVVVPNLFKDNGQLSFAYTQQSYWQAYQFKRSSPFRETNHEAELMLSFFNDFDLMVMKNRMITWGFLHHSNGRAGQFSRSWNRLYLNFVLEERNLVISIKPWYRIPDEEKRDENPDIEKFYGYGEVLAHYQMSEYSIGLLLRNNFRSRNRGAIQLSWTFPLYNKVNGYFQYFNGYGESLIDYNDSTNRIGLGIMLTNWL